MYICIEPDKASVVNNHPVHIIDNDGKISPSSFIPFCTFGNKMLQMGRHIDEFNQTVCNSFKRRILKEKYTANENYDEDNDDNDDDIDDHLLRYFY